MILYKIDKHYINKITTVYEVNNHISPYVLTNDITSRNRYITFVVSSLVIIRKTNSYKCLVCNRTAKYIDARVNYSRFQ